jgi:hypothetical protein
MAMKRVVILVALVSVLLGGTGGFAFGIFIYPFWFLREPANEMLIPSAARTEVASGKFIQVNKLDPVHWGSGTVSLYQEPAAASVFLHEDFEVGPGPRFHVYLASRETVANGADFEASEKIDLGRLRAFKGSQVYAVPSGTDLGRYRSVVIWCKEFGVLISPAALLRS